MRFDFSKQQQFNREVRQHLRLVRALRTVAGAVFIACGGAVLVFAPPPDARWIGALTWQADERAWLAKQSHRPASATGDRRSAPAFSGATDPALSVIDRAVQHG